MIRLTTVLTGGRRERLTPFRVEIFLILLEFVVNG